MIGVEISGSATRRPDRAQAERHGRTALAVRCLTRPWEVL